ncbi:MAG: DNA-3-methyladenine glycosylase [Planctomycetota bacterium]|nr:DNA-3-methyladenine glycosylase [Planctomycetota bacterium]
MNARRLRFSGDAFGVARSLLGQHLVRCLDGQRLSGRIVEVEAYLGPHDLACHTVGGRRTARNESMYLGGGHAYVYLIYGMHHCVNITTGPRESGAAVLIRGLEPLESLEVMHVRRGGIRSTRDLCRGPGRLCEALAIDRDLDGIDLRESRELWIERAQSVSDSDILVGPRIGLGEAGLWSDAPLRLGVRGSGFVSRPVPVEMGSRALERAEMHMKSILKQGSSDMLYHGEETWRGR